MPSRIRQARPQDAASIAHIANGLIRDTLFTFTTTERTAEDIATRLQQPQPQPPFLVAELDGRVVGFATYGPFRNGPGYRHTQEHSIQLAPPAQGRGLGRGLMQGLQTLAQAQGIHVLVAGISSANPNAVGFHAALGFSKVGRMPQVGRKWDQWLDLILMQKQL